MLYLHIIEKHIENEDLGLLKRSILEKGGTHYYCRLFLDDPEAFLASTIMRIGDIYRITNITPNSLIGIRSGKKKESQYLTPYPEQITLWIKSNHIGQYALEKMGYKRYFAKALIANPHRVLNSSLKKLIFVYQALGIEPNALFGIYPHAKKRKRYKGDRRQLLLF